MRKGKVANETKKTPEKEDNNIELIVDTKMGEPSPNTFYLPPSGMSKSGILNAGRFSSCTIRNVDTDDIKASSLVGIYTSLVNEAKVTVIIKEPIAVMQPYQAKVVEANARLAGFENIKTSDITLPTENPKRKEETLCVTFMKPARKA